MHHKSKQRRQKAWDDVVAPGVIHRLLISHGQLGTISVDPRTRKPRNADDLSIL